MSTLTTNYQFILPSVNNAIDENIWGGQNNTNWSSDDAVLFAIDTGNIGSTSPTIPALAAPTAGMTWINNTSGAGGTWPIQVYDGDEWVTTGMLNTENHTYVNTGNVAVNVQTFPTAGTYTYTPTEGMSYCIVECIGAGGGSGSALAGSGSYCTASGGGGGGAYVKQIYTNTQIGASQPLVIGAGGAAGSGGNGGSGGTTTFGTLLSSPGGFGGKASTGNSAFQIAFGGDGGQNNGASGFLAIPGNAGGNGISQYSGAASIFACGGQGGGCGGYSGNIYGPQLTTGFGTGTAGVYGAGASGSAGVNNAVSAGAAGGAGIIIITEYI